MPRFNSLRCPVCQEPLEVEGKVWRCVNKHSFDVAKEGYLNLLLAHKKKSVDPGDSREMLQSRRVFLNAGAYDFLPEALLQILVEHLELDDSSNALDIGCGEGFYTAFMSSKTQGSLNWSGVDISREGVRMAAKQYKDIPFVVSSNFELPFESATQNVVMQIFAPSSLDEVKRVLKSGALYLRVTPGEHHLMGLKEKLYDAPKEHDQSHMEHEGLGLIHEQRITKTVNFDSAEKLHDLFQMTPFYWTVGEVRREELAKLVSLETLLDFHVAVYQCDEPPAPSVIWGAKPNE